MEIGVTVHRVTHRQKSVEPPTRLNLRKTTDAEARLFRKGAGKEARLCFMGHPLMESKRPVATAAARAWRGVDQAAVEIVVAGPAQYQGSRSSIGLIGWVGAILDIGRPQSRSGVVKALSDRGIQVGGQDPATNVGTIMWRAKDEFVNLKPHGYWPRDVAYGAASYHPAQDNEPEHEGQENGSSAAAETEKWESGEGDLWRAGRPAA